MGEKEAHGSPSRLFPVAENPNLSVEAFFARRGGQLEPETGSVDGTNVLKSTNRTSEKNNNQPFFSVGGWVKR